MPLNSEAESDSAPTLAAPSLTQPHSSVAKALARHPLLHASSHGCCMNDSAPQRGLHSNTPTAISAMSNYLEDQFSTGLHGLHGPHLLSLDRPFCKGVGVSSACGRACGFDSDSCASCTAAAVGADSNFGTKVVEAANHQHTASSCEEPVLAEAMLSTSTTTADVSRLEGQGETADNPEFAGMALQWTTTSRCIDSAAKAGVSEDSDGSGDGSSDSSESYSSACQVSFSSYESDTDDYDADSDEPSWLLDSGATNQLVTGRLK